MLGVMTYDSTVTGFQELTKAGLQLVSCRVFVWSKAIVLIDNDAFNNV